MRGFVIRSQLVTGFDCSLAQKTLIRHCTLLIWIIFHTSLFLILPVPFDPFSFCFDKSYLFATWVTVGSDGSQLGSNVTFFVAFTRTTQTHTHVFLILLWFFKNKSPCFSSNNSFMHQVKCDLIALNRNATSITSRFSFLSSIYTNFSVRMI